MKKFIEFIKKPKNLYLSIAFMFMLVIGLSTITFSYYIEDSTNANQVMKVNKNNTFIQSDDIDSDEITLPPKESRTISINVINNNSVDSIYKIYYLADSCDVISDKKIVNALKPNDVLNYNLTLTNNSDEIKVIKLGIVTGYMGDSIKIPSESIEIK